MGLGLGEAYIHARTPLTSKALRCFPKSQGFSVPQWAQAGLLPRYTLHSYKVPHTILSPSVPASILLLPSMWVNS